MKKSTCLYALALIIPMGLCAMQPASAARYDRDYARDYDRGYDRHYDRDRDWHEHAREAHEWRHRHWHNGHVIYEQSEPYVTYAPPVVVQPPPPEYDDQNSDVNLVFPLNFH